MKTLALIAFVFSCFAADAALSDEKRALSACRKMSKTQDKQDCIRVVSGRKFDPEVVEACARGINADNFGRFTVDCFREMAGKTVEESAAYNCMRLTDQSMMDCLRMVADRTPSKEILACNKLFKDAEIMSCLRQVSWTSSSPTEGTLTGGADGATPSTPPTAK